MKRSHLLTSLHALIGCLLLLSAQAMPLLACQPVCAGEAVAEPVAAAPMVADDACCASDTCVPDEQLARQVTCSACLELCCLVTASQTFMTERGAESSQRQLATLPTQPTVLPEVVQPAQSISPARPAAPLRHQPFYIWGCSLLL